MFSSDFPVWFNVIRKTRAHHLKFSSAWSLGNSISSLFWSEARWKISALVAKNGSRRDSMSAFSPLQRSLFYFLDDTTGQRDAVRSLRNPATSNRARSYSRRLTNEDGRLVIRDYQLANFALGRISAATITMNSNLNSLPCLGHVRCLPS